MEIKRISLTPFVPAETTPKEVQPEPKISTGVGEASDSFEIRQSDQFSFLDNKLPQTAPQSANKADLLLEFQKRQFNAGNFAKPSVNRAPEAIISEQQLNELKVAINNYVSGSEPSSFDEMTKALQQAAATLSSFPTIGPIIAAILSAIAAALIAIGQLMEKQKEHEAAAKERAPDVELQETDQPKEKNPLEKLKDVLAVLIRLLNSSDRD